MARGVDHLVHLHQVRVVDALEDLDLAADSLHVGHLLDAGLLQNLDAHTLPRHVVDAELDLPESALAQRLAQNVVADASCLAGPRGLRGARLLRRQGAGNGLPNSPPAARGPCARPPGASLPSPGKRRTESRWPTWVPGRVPGRATRLPGRPYALRGFTISPPPRPAAARAVGRSSRSTPSTRRPTARRDSPAVGSAGGAVEAGSLSGGSSRLSSPPPASGTRSRAASPAGRRGVDGPRGAHQRERGQ